MELKDLLEKPLSECTDDELEKRAHLLGKLKIAVDRSAPKRKSNKDHTINDLLKGLSKEQVAKLVAKLQEGK